MGDPSLRTPSAGLFVGRDALLGQLTSELEQALDGRAGACWLVGEAGMGKTRTSLELAKHAGGFRIHRARCHEDRGSPPFWLWIQLLRSLRRSPAPTVESPPGEAQELVRLLPELAGAELESAPTQSSEVAQRRFLVFDTIVRCVLQHSEREPLLLLIDDLHWSDRSSLLLLRLLVRELPGSRIFVLGTYRDSELAQVGGLADVVADITGDPCSHEVVLPPLDRAATALIVHSLTRSLPSEPLIDRIYAMTEGNPFFIEQIGRLLVGQSSEAADPISAPRLALPRGVLHSIRRQLRALPEPSQALLRVAAVIGREFSLRTLRGALEDDSDAALAALDDAHRMGLIEATDLPDRWRFRHALIQQAVYEEQAPLARAGLHARVAQVLQGGDTAASAETVADLAHHFLAAVPVGSLDDAVHYAHRAGQNAIASAAYEAGVVYFDRAASLLAGAGRASAPEHLAVLLDLADAQRLASRTAEAAAVFRRAFLLAGERGAPEAMARAALGHAEVSFVQGESNPLNIAQLQEALAHLSPDDSSMRAMLLARLAVEVAVADPPGPSDELLHGAIAMARRLGDPATLAYTLIRWNWVASGPRHLDDRAAAAAEILTLAEQVGDRWMDLEGRAFHLVELMERAEIDRLRVELDEFARRAERLKHPRHLWSVPRWHAVLAAMTGDFAAAETHSRAAFEIGAQYVQTQAARAFLAQYMAIRREQGAAAELVDGFRSLVQEHPQLTSWRCSLANIEASLGNLDEARAELKRLLDIGLSIILTRPYGFVGIAELSEACDGVGDRDAAAQLYRILEPHAGMIVETGVGVIALGIVDYFLGLTAETSGAPERARVHFEAALAIAERLGARPWIARAAYRLSRILANGAPADRQRAAQLAAEASALAERIGLRRMLRDTPAPAPAATAPLAPSGAQVFRREGDFWVLAFAGRSATTRDQLGLHYLAALLREPGRDFHATALVALVAGQLHGERPAASGDAGPMLDEVARRAYQERLRDLHGDLEEAERLHDSGRVERIQTEIGALEDELRRAFGLGGRPRHAGSPNERARVNVTRTIRAALRRIAAVHPELGAHLDATVRTGNHIAYRPDPRIAHAWQT